MSFSQSRNRKVYHLMTRSWAFFRLLSNPLFSESGLWQSVSRCRRATRQILVKATWHEVLKYTHIYILCIYIYIYTYLVYTDRFGHFLVTSGSSGKDPKPGSLNRGILQTCLKSAIVFEVNYSDRWAYMTTGAADQILLLLNTIDM